ncbi:MAG: 4Fe-4S binding protein [Pseudomonadota bacterium]
MTEKDAYEDLADMYAQTPMMVDEIRGSLMEVLRVQFLPGEAQLAVKVGLDGGNLDEIAEKTGMDKGKLKTMLFAMAKKGTMWISPEKEGEERTYRTIGIAGPGLIETGGWGNVRFPHSVKLMKALYGFQNDFAKHLLAKFPMAVARVWTTPEALPDDADAGENVAHLVREAGAWGVSTCSCRLPHWVAEPGNHCDHLLETCIFLGDNARWGREHGLCREITADEAIDILSRSNEDGLVHSYDPDEFICNCCPDCCVLQKGMNEPGGIVLQPAGFAAVIDTETCSACGTCAGRCPVNAISVDEHAAVDEKACLGCAVCWPSCPTGSVGMKRRAEPVSTPLATL